MKIRNKINNTFVLTFIFVASLATLIIGIFTINIIKNNIYSYIVSNNVARAEHVRTFILDQEKTSLILAAASVYRDFLKEPVASAQYPIIKAKIVSRFARTLASDPLINEVFILDKNGKLVVSSDKTQEGEDKSEDPYFLNTKTVTFFKDVYYSNIVNKLNYTVSSPILDDNDNFLGVSVIRYLTKDLFAVVHNENSLDSTEENFLVNKNKFFITPSLFFGSSVILKQKVETQNVNLCFSQKEIDYVTKNGYKGLSNVFGSRIIDTKDYRGVEVIAAHSYIPETNWCLVTKTDKASILSFQNNLILLLSFMSFVALLLLTFIGTIVSKKITNPLSLLQSGVEKIKRGDFDFKVKVTSKDEIGELATSFNLMIEEVKKAKYEIEKKVLEQTKEIRVKAKDLEDQKNAILNILDDVEKEKEKTESFANDLEKFKLAVDNASDQVIIADIDGIVVYGNNAVERITGFKPEEAVGKKAGVLWKTPMSTEYYKNMWDIIKNQKKAFISEIQNRRKNGDLYIANISISPVLNNKNEIIYFVAIEHDITKEKEIDKAKTEFVSLASHQLRTPLSAINWYTEMLLAGDAGKINKEQRNYLNEVAIGNKRMVDLVSALLSVSRLDLGTFIIEPKSTDVLELSKSVVSEMKPKILEKKLKIEEVYGENVEKFNADEKLLRIIFQNLLSNAVKYTPDNGLIKLNVVILKKGDIFGEKIIEEDSLGFSVSDNGIGIPEKQKEKIFLKLFRADNARDSDTEGTGLGLYIIKSIVDQSGGTTWFKSTEGKGTVFYVIFPLSGMKEKEGTKKLD